jgi:hypothetical protein
MSSWTAIAEKKPPSAPVLAFHPTRSPSVFVAIIPNYASAPTRGLVFHDDPNKPETVDGFTHWMPLPEEPPAPPLTIEETLLRDMFKALSNYEGTQDEYERGRAAAYKDVIALLQAGGG